jgi:hypothetical protein
MKFRVPQELLGEPFLSEAIGGYASHIYFHRLGAYRFTATPVDHISVQPNALLPAEMLRGAKPRQGQPHGQRFGDLKGLCDSGRRAYRFKLLGVC